MSKLVSVIIPAYNHEQYIFECLDSVMNQTYEDIQLIIINDGSKDNTEKIINQYIAKNNFNNIEFYSKNNQGLSKTINFGLKKAKGDYVAVLASDDLWMSNKLEKQVDFLEQNLSIALIYSDTLIINSMIKTDIRYSQYKPSIRQKFINSIQNINAFKSLLIENFIIASTVVIRKSVLDDLGDFDENIEFEDYDMWLRITKKYPIAYLDSPLAYYRMHDYNMSNNKTKMIKGTFRILSKQMKQSPYVNNPVKKINVYVRFYLRSLINSFKKRALKKGLQKESK